MTAAVTPRPTSGSGPSVNEEVQAEGWRCRRAADCSDRETTADQVTGDFLGWVGAGIGQADGLCRVDSANARGAVAKLPADVAGLGEMVVPSLEVRFDDTMTVDGGRGAAPGLPIATHPLAIRDYIRGLLADWALTLVAAMIDPDELTLSERDAWEPELARDDPDACAEFLVDGWDLLLAHGPVVQRLRSVTADPMSGAQLAARYGPPSWRRRPVFVEGEGWTTEPVRPDELITRAGDADDFWYRPDGVTAALQMAAIHEQVLTGAGWGRPRPEPVPCPECRRRRLIRKPLLNLVECEACTKRLSDDEYERYRRGGPQIMRGAR